MSLPEIFVGGLRVTGSGYPNASNTLRVLEEHQIARIVDLGEVLPEGIHLWQLSRLPVLKRVSAALRIFFSNMRSAFRVLKRYRGDDWVYVPYPAAPFLFIISFLPRRLRPRCLADAYISLWDSSFADRKSHGRLAGALIRRFESRALRAASIVLVDTAANQQYLCKVLNLSANRVVSLPLAIDSAKFTNLPAYRPRGGALEVCFIGTMIPLHGIDVILEAARLLGERSDVHFLLIGDGQVSNRIRELGTERSNLTWRRDWLTIDQIADALARADICLGVFGGQQKAARVLPFKLYYALAAGRPIISQELMSVPAESPIPPLITVDTSRGIALAAQELADAVLKLATSEELRIELAAAASQYFDRHLSDAVIAESWRRLLRPGVHPSGSAQVPLADSV